MAFARLKKVQNFIISALSVKNFVLMMVQMLKSRYEPKKFGGLCGLWHYGIMALWYSIDQEFHVDDENTRESQF
jgi:hypothetical protein